MGEIMLEHALQLSSDPSNELVIIMGHGPMTPKENEMELAIMAKHAKAIQQGGGFKDVKYWNVQDDLPPDKRAANVAIVRGWIKDARDQGMGVIVVTNALTQSGIMGRLKRDVEGTGAKFNDAGLMQNPRFSDWINAAVEENLSDKLGSNRSFSKPRFDPWSHYLLGSDCPAKIRAISAASGYNPA
jgi:hypothetical protein